MVSRKEAGIRKFEEFKGKRFNISNPGAGTQETIMMMMEALDMEIGDFSLASELKLDEHGAALCENKIDGFAYVVGSPVANIQEPIITMVRTGISAPLHEGAIRYYRGKGLDVVR